MPLAEIFDIVIKGLGVVSTLIAVGKNAGPAIKIITDIVTGAQLGIVTEKMLADAETELDALIEEFNEPID